MRLFEYRQPRLNSSFSLDFYTDGQIVRGFCTDLSNGGLRARFDGPLNVGDSGSLILRHPAGQFTLPAIVAHLEETEVGLSFVCKTHEDRLVLKEFSIHVEGHRLSA